LIEFVKQKKSDVLESVGFMDGEEAKEKMMLDGNQKLFEKVRDDIKSFCGLMHDACVRFYQLDARQSMDTDKSECLYNLISSLVLKSPVYGDVHYLIQLMHKQKVMKIA
jgi:hypothetical protein